MNGVNEGLQNLKKTIANTDFRSGVKRDEQDLPVRQKTAKFQFCHEARKDREQSRCAKDKSQEAQKRLKSQRHRDTSRRQPKKELAGKTSVISRFAVITAIQIV